VVRLFQAHDLLVAHHVYEEIGAPMTATEYLQVCATIGSARNDPLMGKQFPQYVRICRGGVGRPEDGGAV